VPAVPPRVTGDARSRTDSTTHRPSHGGRWLEYHRSARYRAVAGRRHGQSDRLHDGIIGGVLCVPGVPVQASNRLVGGCKVLDFIGASGPSLCLN
jgi:hypothetical protein